MKRDAAHILVVEDDAILGGAVVQRLKLEEFEVTWAQSCAEALLAMKRRTPDFVLSDIVLPDGSGEDLYRKAQSFLGSTPIVFATAFGEIDQAVRLMKAGADDYVTKPFDPRELLARIRSVLRRASAPAAVRMGEGRVRFGRCVLDLDSHKLFGDDGEEVPLTSMEFDLMRAFAANPNRVLSRDQILNTTQNRDWDPYDRSVDIRIARLRKKVEPDPEKPQVIKTVRGGGYLFSPKL